MPSIVRNLTRLSQWPAVRNTLSDESALAGAWTSQNLDLLPYCTYMRWFEKPLWVKHKIFSTPVHISQLRLLIQFRTGSHKLPIVTGRWLNIPRSQRVCQACQTSSVCDEYHLVFECPALDCIRQKYTHLFPNEVLTMKQFIWQANIPQVVYFLQECFATLMPSLRVSEDDC